MSWQILQGDALERLRDLDAGSVQTCVTSPPYWGLRDYGDEGQLGLEPTPGLYVANLVAVFREVRRVLRDDGTVWLNLGDSYVGSGPNRQGDGVGASGETSGAGLDTRTVRRLGLKAKDLVGIPWRVAFALQADGWWLRSDIIWNKPNPMPESVTDRPTTAHEHIFLLAKQARYFYDADAIREDNARVWDAATNGAVGHNAGHGDWGQSGKGTPEPDPAGRNKRSVWTVTTQPYAEAHFATFPPKLIEPCILAGAPPKCCGECGAPWERITDKGENPYPGSSHDHTEDLTGTGAQRHSDGTPSGTIMAKRWHERQSPQTVGWRSTCAHADDSGRSLILDPFAGSGTTGLVALRHDRSFIGIELSADYCEMARNRIRDDAPLLNSPLEVDSEPLGYGFPVPIADKQAGHGRRHAGFNERWKNR